MIQAASWTLKEQVTFDKIKITSTNWAVYPVMRLSDAPEIEVAIISRPDQPVPGGGKISVPPTGAAITNAIYKACGKRVYDLPVRLGESWRALFCWMPTASQSLKALRSFWENVHSGVIIRSVFSRYQGLKDRSFGFISTCIC